MLRYLQKHWKLFAAEGVFFIILGSTAIIIPQVFTVGIALFFGWLLLIGGVFQIIRALSMIDMPGFSLWFFIGSLQTLIGYFLVTDPTKGVMTLTMLLTILFAFEGIIKIYLAFMMRPLARWSGVCFSGFTSLLLAIVVWLGWPGTALWVLGLLLGINMIFLGWSLLNISLHHKTLE
ncbi:MAG: HdeD family acid-resistance protein [Methylomarinum sp.]|nr:HdeD family acid-resistance protein [Methylomarinum sp.]